jgi:YtxH-like protein
MEKEAANDMSDDREELEYSRDEQDEDEGSNRVAWFITGVLIGATVAILYAPKSGKDTRQLFADKTQKGRDAVSEKTKDIAEASRDMFERGRKVVEDAAELFDRARKLVRG